LSASKESKYVEFKEFFDPDSTGDCCEIAKDFVALANSGGGIVVIGLDSCGVVAPRDLSKVLALDPADVTNKLAKYVGGREISFSMQIVEKENAKLVAFLIDPAPTPLLFEKPGTYSDGAKGQKTAFGQGTVFYRHGAKSEPGTNLDLEKSLERRLESIRKSWLSGVARVVRRPVSSGGTAIEAAAQENTGTSFANVRTVTDGTGLAVRLTRDPEAETSGTFLHEAVSEAMFGEINNVMDVNRFLFPGRDRFLLGIDVYYRIYAEREAIRQDAKEIEKLFFRGLGDYVPFLYWCTLLSDETLAAYLADLVLWPKGKYAYSLPRIAPLLGNEFCSWLLQKFKAKWGKYSQPPEIYWQVEKIAPSLTASDRRLAAARMGPSSVVPFTVDKPSLVSEIMENGSRLAEIVSKACLGVFEGEKALGGTARDFDYLAYGGDLMQRDDQISSRIYEIVQNRLPDISG
jgi:hypothetical protein